jgi:hypothetical protein
MLTTLAVPILTSVSLHISGVQAVHCDLAYMPERQQIEGVCNADAIIEIISQERTKTLTLPRAKGLRIVPVNSRNVIEVRISTRD